MGKPEILVLGVGNILLTDEGAGVHCIHRLQQQYAFSDNVRLLDGGTLGMRLLDSISKATQCIVADVALQGFVPGTLSRLTINDVRTANALKQSMHQLSFSETLTLAEAMGILPPTIIVAMEPCDMTTMSVSMTPSVAEKIDAMCAMVLEEITNAGGTFRVQPDSETQEEYNVLSYT